MTQPQRRSLYALVIWGLAALVVVPLFLLNEGYLHWSGEGDRRPLAAAVVLLLGFIAFWVMLHLTRPRQGGQDERDAIIQGKSSGFALIAVMAYVFVTSILVYIRYEAQRTAPVGWLWFLAYTTFLCGWISASAASLWYYASGLAGRE